MKMNNVILFGVLALTTFFSASAEAAREYAHVQKFLFDLANQNPHTTELIEIGQNSQGDTIVGVKIGSGPVKNLVVGTHHGNEYASTELALYAARDYAKNPIVGRTIFVIPVLNISGYNANRREESVGTGRSSTADPNRDYPGPCGTKGPFKLKSTQALADFIAKEDIVTLATLHAFGNMILYPWGISTRDLKTPYEKEYIELGNICASASGYKVGNSTELLYPADGAFEDYAYWRHGIWSMLFEIGSRKNPNDGELSRIVQENLPGLRKFMENAPDQRATNHGFHGHCDTYLMGLDLRDE